jgi:hypothetical protein
MKERAERAPAVAEISQFHGNKTGIRKRLHAISFSGIFR